MTRQDQQAKLIEPIIEQGRDELHLAEFPLNVLSKRVSRSVAAIEYSDWATVNGQHVHRVWRVVGGNSYGLPAAADQDVLVVLVKMAVDSGLESPKVKIGSAYHYLRLLGWDRSASSYRRLEQSLVRYGEAFVHSENTIWDRESNELVGKMGFNIIDHYRALFDLGRRPKKGEFAQQPSLPLGYVQLGDGFFRLLKQGSIKDLDLDFYAQLSTPLSRRVFRYLDKKRYRRHTFSRDLYQFGAHLGLVGSALQLYKRDFNNEQTLSGEPLLVPLPKQRYYPSQLKRLLQPSLEELKNKGFLDRYIIREGKRGPAIDVVFSEVRDVRGAKEAAATGSQKAIFDRMKNEEEYLVHSIMEVTGDEHSRAYYRKVVRELGQGTVWELLSMTRQAAQDDSEKTNPAKLFTYLAQTKRKKQKEHRQTPA